MPSPLQVQLRRLIALGPAALIAAVAAAPSPAQWAPDGAAVCTESHTQGPVAIASDGAGGVVIAWPDARLGSRIAIYAQRLDASGVPMWSDNGVPVCTTLGDRGGVIVLPAGAGGVVIFWHDGRSNNQDDIYAQRLDGQGVPLWTINGIALSTANLDQRYPVAVGDGAFTIPFQRGFNVAWVEEDTDHNAIIRAQHVNLSGAAMWTTAAVGGVAITSTARVRSGLAAASDDSPNVHGGPAGVVVTWEEPGTSAANDIYAGRVDYSGTSQWGTNGVAGRRDAGLPRLRQPVDTEGDR